jgi:predicted transcriptional regulator
MYEVTLSNLHLVAYLELLEDNGLLWFEPESKTYTTTAKGIAFLKTYEYMGSLVNPSVATAKRRAIKHPIPPVPQ